MNAQLSPTRGYIGGGNIAGILGLSPFKTPLDEYFVITGQAPDTTPQREAFFKRRKALEPFAAEVFEQETGRKIIRRNERYSDPVHGFIKAEVDFEVDDGWNGETKTVHPFALRDWGPTGTDEAPIYVIAQAMHGMARNGAAGCWIHALVGLDDDRIYRIERDEDTIAAITSKAVSFWNDHVLPGTPPPPTTVEDLAALFPRDTGRTVEADAKAFLDAEELKRLKAELKNVEAAHDAIADRLRLYLRDAAILVPAGGGKPLLTWKSQESRRFDEQAFKAAHPDLHEAFKTTRSTRVLRVK